MTHTNLVEKIAGAIHAACNVPHSDTFGSYDYSNYEGNSHAFVVKAPGQREVVFSSANPAEATAFWERAEKNRIAQAALTAIEEAGYVVVPMGEDSVQAGLMEMDPLGALVDWSADRHEGMTREILRDGIAAMIAQAEKEG